MGSTIVLLHFLQTTPMFSRCVLKCSIQDSLLGK